MAMTVTIFLRGSIICFLKNRRWVLELPTDSTHLGKFVHSGTAPQVPELRYPGVNRTIRFTITPGTFESPRKGGNFSRILNMNDSKMHNGELVERRKGSSGREVVRIEIPTGVLNHSASTTRKYSIERTKPNPGRPIALNRTVSAELKLVFEVKPDQTLTIDFENSNLKATTPLSFPFREGNLVMAIDNDCGAACKSTNDFELFYECVGDSDGKTEFNAGKVKSKEKSPEGNCDPATSDPPPGP